MTEPSERKNEVICPRCGPPSACDCAMSAPVSRAAEDGRGTAFQPKHADAVDYVARMLDVAAPRIGGADHRATAREAAQLIRAHLGADRAALLAAVTRACTIIETGDRRLMASDGDCGGQPPDLTLDEWRELYVVLDTARRSSPSKETANAG